MKVLGIMSGTSLDGMDLALVDFDDNNPANFRFLATHTYGYSPKWEKRLRDAFHATGQELTLLDAEYGYFIGDTVNRFLVETGAARPDLIASHGQTIFHAPEQAYTLQIGSGAHIAARTGITTVCDFRRQDVALGGQGAPLVPIGDRMLFGEYDYCLNIGGFANISYDDEQDRRIAFDTGPANIVLNTLARRVGKTFDAGGQIARTGKITPGLLEALNDLPYYRDLRPKSLGWEFVETEILPMIDRNELSVNDALATFTEHIAMQIARHIRGGRVLVTGGGAYNKYLMERIRTHTNAEIVIPSPQLIDYKEALIFALLGLLRIQGKPNVLASVTGAPWDHCSGVVFEV